MTPNPLDPKASLTKLLGTLGVTVGANATDAEIIAAAEAFKPAAAAAATSTEITTLSADIDKRLKAIEARSETSERDGLVALATSQGKVIPLTAEQIKTTSLTTLGAIVANLQPTVPLEARGKAAIGAEQRGKVVALSADDKAVIKALKISEEDYIKSNPDLAAAAAV